MIHVYIYVCIYTQVYMYIYILISINIYIYIYVYTCIHSYICMYIFINKIRTFPATHSIMLNNKKIHMVQMQPELT